MQTWDGNLRSFCISRYYPELLSDTSQPEMQEYLHKKLRDTQKAIWAIGQQENTLLRCTQVILTQQKLFFREEAVYLRPPRMAEVA